MFYIVNILLCKILFLISKIIISFYPQRIHNQLHMKGKFIFYTVVGILMFFAACVPPEFGKKSYTTVSIDLSDARVQQIFHLRDRQTTTATDSLLRYLNDNNSTYRYLAAMAFGSNREVRAVDTLGKLLKDNSMEVRTAAAFALGQIGSIRAEPMLIRSFERIDTGNRFGVSNAAILEAIGKCGTRRSLDNLLQIQSYGAADSVLHEGQALGILRFGLRDTVSLEAVRKMAGWVANAELSNRVRIVAANYLMRVKNIRLDTSATLIAKRFVRTDPNPFVRMALARALGKSHLPIWIMPTLDSILRDEKDWRVRTNALYALHDIEYKMAHPLLENAIRDRNLHVAHAAAEFFTNKGNEMYARAYQNLAFDTSLVRSVRTRMLGAALRWSVYYPRQRDSLNSQLITWYRLAASPQEKAEILRGGLAYYSANYLFLTEEALKREQTEIVKTAAAQALAFIAANNQEVTKTFRDKFWKAKQDLKAILFQLVKSGSEGMCVEAVKALRNPEAAFNKQLLRDSVSILVNTLQHLKIPAQYETYDEIAQTVNWILDSTFIKKRKLIPRSTNWTIFKTLSNNPIATVRTSKGTFKMRLLPQIAPATVASFVALARSGFFSGKYFHRIVPNFVVQTGCPRGDGYGSLDFSLASEIGGLHYNTEGVVGMASAGANTEGTQWFVTHSPTFHLDPNYTIFADVVEGMDVVNRLQIGDSIQGLTVQ